MSIYYILSLTLFCLGFLGIFLRKDLVSVLLCIELMLSSINILLVLFSSFFSGTPQASDGQILVFFVMGMAAIEVALGIVIMMNVFKKIDTVYLDEISVQSE